MLDKKTQSDVNILALETSCDETAAAIVCNGRTIIRNIVASQMAIHQRYGGVVPEVASRQHILSLVPVLQQTFAGWEGGWNAIHAVATTYGPGLSGALLTGLNAAKAIAWQRNLPFIGINHLEAHIYANWLVNEKDESPPTFPVVALVVSGGHTLLVLLTDHGDYQLLGQTRDDAAGEAFDKVARLLGLGYPGGPAIEQAATQGHTSEVLPRAWLRNTYDFSFSGLKTAVLHKVQPPEQPERPGKSDHGKQSKQSATQLEEEQVVQTPDTPQAKRGSSSMTVAQLAYAFQESVVDVLVTKTIRAARAFNATEILLAGGVAANKRLREELARRADRPVRYPPISLCTDNAAMVAAAAYYRFQMGERSHWDLDVEPNLRL